jgi:hypothetical protein
MQEEQPPAFDRDRDEADEQTESDQSGYEGAGVEEGGGYQRSPEEGGGYERSGSEGGAGYDPRREGEEP